MAGNRIAEIRRSKGLSQRALAEALHVSPGYISRLEAGHRGAQLDTLYAVAAALGVPVTDLFTHQSMEYLPDLEPYAPPGGSKLAQSLRSGSEKMFKALTNAVSEVGFAKGDLFFVEMCEPATSELCSNDIVVAEIIPSPPKKPVLLLRQFISPHLLITNSRDQNCLPVHMLNENIRIIGKILK